MSPAVSLLLRMLDAARAGRVAAALRHQFNAEAAALGPEAMATARQQVGAERQAERLEAAHG